jgi:hypothetical protein
MKTPITDLPIAISIPVCTTPCMIGAIPSCIHFVASQPFAPNTYLIGELESLYKTPAANTALKLYPT